MYIYIVASFFREPIAWATQRNLGDHPEFVSRLRSKPLVAWHGMHAPANRKHTRLDPSAPEVDACVASHRGALQAIVDSHVP